MVSLNKFFLLCSIFLSFFYARASDFIGSLSCPNQNGPYSILIPRSQSVDSARELIGWQNLINRCDEDCGYGAFSFTAEYQQSFRGSQLVRAILGDDATIQDNDLGITASGCDQGSSTLTVSGSQAGGRGTHEWLADYFGLPTDFRSHITFTPRLRNAIFDFNFYFGLDEWTKGLYFRIHAPIVWTESKMQATELIVNAGTKDYIAGYMQPSLLPNANLQKSFLVATDGYHGTFGDVVDDFQFGLIGGTPMMVSDSIVVSQNGCTTRAGLSDIEMALGWNFLCCDDYHFGFSFRVSAPAGNTPTLRYLLEPIVGNGHYAGFGGGITSHYMFWQSCDADRSFGLWFDLNILHLFKNYQFRAFDLTNKANSRYMLFEKFTAPAVNLLVSGLAPDAQYLGAPGGLVHAINVTTFSVNTSFDAQADLTLKLCLQLSNWEFDFGYNLWARSSEKIYSTGGVVGFPANTYAIKGDAQIYGFLPEEVPTFPIPLSATENTATAYAGANTPTFSIFNELQYLNPSIDNVQPASSGMGEELVDGLDVGQQNTSYEPVFVAESDIDFRGTPRSITNKVFVHINYVWRDCDDIVPFFGVGANVEVAQSCSLNRNTTNESVTRGCTCKGMHNAGAVTQWGVWLKTGISYS